MNERDAWEMIRAISSKMDGDEEVDQPFDVKAAITTIGALAVRYGIDGGESLERDQLREDVCELLLLVGELLRENTRLSRCFALHALGSGLDVN